MKIRLMLCLLAISEVGNAQYNDLHNFVDSTGKNPWGTLTLSGKVLYGFTEYGGPSNYGCIFSIDTNGGEYKDLFNFNGKNNGADPYLSQPIISGGKLYGMTLFGGVNGQGVIFSIDTDGNRYKELLNFNITNGANPAGSLILSGNVLYGMTLWGGIHNHGCIFSIDTNGDRYTTLFSFDSANGANPYGSLTLSGNILYGMTSIGGTQNDGVIFSIDTNGGNYIILHNFNGPNGEKPLGSLTLSGNMLYGMTSNGGAYGVGCIFSMDTNGGYTDFFDFFNIGEHPFGSLTISGDVLYGMTTLGGGDGNIFSINISDNAYTNLFAFDGTNGSLPQGSLTLSGNILYGLTSGGAINNGGNIFSFKDTTITNSINEVKVNYDMINVYPNPNSGNFTLALSNVNVACSVEIYNMLGEIVYTKSLSQNQNDNTINLPGQSNGVYLYRVLQESGGLVGEGKVVIQ